MPNYQRGDCINCPVDKIVAECNQEGKGNNIMKIKALLGIYILLNIISGCSFKNDGSDSSSSLESIDSSVTSHEYISDTTASTIEIPVTETPTTKTKIPKTTEAMPPSSTQAEVKQVESVLPESTKQQFLNQVTMRAEFSSEKSTGNIDVTITNNSNVSISADEQYKIQKSNGVEWVDIPLSVTWIDWLINIPPDGSHTFHYDIGEILSGDDKPTQYRIIKSVFVEQQKYDLFGTFELNRP